MTASGGHCFRRPKREGSVGSKRNGYNFKMCISKRRLRHYDVIMSHNPTRHPLNNTHEGMFNVPPPHNGTDGADNTMKGMKQAGRSSFLTKSNHAQAARILCRTIDLTHCLTTNPQLHALLSKPNSKQQHDELILARSLVHCNCMLLDGSIDISN